MEEIKPEIYTLIAPNEYKGYAAHPTLDKTIRQVIKATITRCTHLSCWYDLKIEFENYKIFTSSSGSIKGCKQIFAFQCKAGSKWEQLFNNE